MAFLFVEFSITGMFCNPSLEIVAAACISLFIHELGGLEANRVFSAVDSSTVCGTLLRHGITLRRNGLIAKEYVGQILCRE